MQKKINIAIFIIIIFLIMMFSVLSIYNNKYKLKEYTKTLFYMNDYIYVKIYDTDDKRAKKGLKEIDKIYKKYHILSNRYKSFENTNNIYYLYYNNEKMDNLKIDNELYDMISFGKKWYKESNGLIDISMGNITDIWNMYRDSKTGFPSESELTKALTDNIDDIKLLDNNHIKNNNPNIDLGNIPKVFALNEIKNYLKDNKIDKYFINADKNIVVGNYYNNNGNYSIGLENPDTKGGIYEVIKGNNFSVATSGGSGSFYEYDGKRYYNIINPNTLMPSTNMKSVSVISDDIKKCSMLSQMLFLMNVEDGKALIDEMDNIEAIWYTNDNKQVKSKNFDKYIKASV